MTSHAFSIDDLVMRSFLVIFFIIIMLSVFISYLIIKRFCLFEFCFITENGFLLAIVIVRIDYKFHGRRLVIVGVARLVISRLLLCRVRATEYWGFILGFSVFMVIL